MMPDEMIEAIADDADRLMEKLKGKGWEQSQWMVREAMPAIVEYEADAEFTRTLTGKKIPAQGSVLRPATAREYATWLRGHKEKRGTGRLLRSGREFPEGKIMFADRGTVTIDGTAATRVITAPGVQVRAPGGYGMSSVFRMDDYSFIGHEGRITVYDGPLFEGI